MAKAPVHLDLAEIPYWWEAAPRPKLDLQPLPSRMDVVVIGSGITGLSAARVLARAGRSVAVFDAGDPGGGASSRNAGFVGRTLKHSFRKLQARYGLDRAIAVYREMQAAFDSVTEVIRDERIDCAFRIDGRYIPAPSPAHYEAMAREFEARRRYLGDSFEMVPRGAQHRELGTDRYFGGAIIPDLGGLHPGLYHQGLLDRVRSAGAAIIANTPVEAIRTDTTGGFTIRTARGMTRARDVVVATNGYTDRTVPWFARRVIPFNGYMIATEPLRPEIMDRALPSQRTCIDYNHDPHFVRRSPDGRRILFGGLTGRVCPVGSISARLCTLLGETLPDLKGVRPSHAWTGLCAATFDLWPHIGVHDGVHFALGYNFAGVPMGTYLGQKVALKILGSSEGRTIFDERRFPTVPLYTGKPWFVPHAMAWYSWRDRRDARRAASAGGRIAG